MFDIVYDTKAAFLGIENAIKVWNVFKESRKSFFLHFRLLSTLEISKDSSEFAYTHTHNFDSFLQS